MSQWVQADGISPWIRQARRSVAATMGRPWWLTANGVPCTHVSTHVQCAPCVHHVTWYTHGAHLVCTMWCTPCVHHVHTHGVPSGLIPWYLGTCPKQLLYEIFRWPLTWPRYRSKNRKRLKPISSLGFLDKITKLIIQVLHSDLQRVALGISDVTYFR